MPLFYLSATKPSEIPWWERNSFWGGLSLGVAIVLTVIAAMKHDVRWLLILAFPCFLVALWALARQIAADWLKVVLMFAGAIVILGGLYRLYRWGPGIPLTEPPSVKMAPPRAPEPSPSDLATKQIPSASQIADELAKRLPASPPKEIPSSSGFMQDEPPQFLSETLTPGVTIGMRLAMFNGGPEPIHNTHSLFRVVVSPPKEDHSTSDMEVWKWFKTDIDAYKKYLVKHGDAGVTATPKYEIWNTPRIGPFTPDQIAGIESGNRRLYVLTWAGWKEEREDYVSCSWLQRPGDGHLTDLVWHICSP